MKKVMKVFQVFGSVLNIIAVAALLVMICITIADVFLRELFKAPVVGAIEITRMMMVCMTPAFVSALMNNRHVSVGLLVDRFSRPVQLVFDTIGYGATAIISALMCYQGIIDMNKKILQKQVYTMLKIPTWPFYLIFAISMGFFAIAIIVRLIDKYCDKSESQPVTDQAAAAAESANEEVKDLES